MYSKAYYRMADAFIALSKFKDAKLLFKKLIEEFKISDPDVKDKYKFVNKTLKEIAFKEAISASEKYETNLDP